jgi:large subunit ribosomal protein L6
VQESTLQLILGMAQYYSFPDAGPQRSNPGKIFSIFLVTLSLILLLLTVTTQNADESFLFSAIGGRTHQSTPTRISALSLNAAATATAPLSLDTLSSRVDRPIVIPPGVEIIKKDGMVTVRGPKGTLARPVPDEVQLQQENSILLVKFESDRRKQKSMFGLYQALIKNMVIGVSQDFVKKLEMIGVGYKARIDGKNLILAVGKSHDVIMPIPDGVKVVVEDNIRLVVSGISNEKVGQFCADIRKQRPPEPYKGKGIRYLGEKIILKAGKGGKGKK